MSQNIYTHTLGNIRCTIISDGISPLTIERLMERFPTIPEAELRSALVAQGEEAAIGSSSMNCLLLQTPERTILVDTGVGSPAKENSGQLYDQLRTVIDPAHIDTVFITHAHGDHIGGLIAEDGELSYPNAQVVMSRREFDFWMGEEGLALRGSDYTQRLKSRFAPIEDRLTLLDTEQEIAPGIRTVHMPGHTPGHTGLLIESDGERLLHIVDSMNYPVQFEHPDWPPRFDADPEQATQTRLELMSRAADEGLLVLGYHFTFPGLGKFSRKGSGFAWQAFGAPIG